MAFDDVLLDNLGAIGSHISTTIQLWSGAAVKARQAGGYPAATFWTDLQKQFVSNWDLWNQLTNFSGYPNLPTAYLGGAYGSLAGKSLSTVFARQNLTNALFMLTDLVDQTGNNTIAAANLAYTKSGDLNGQVTINLKVNAPAAGVYKGVALVDPAGGTNYEPLADLLVVAT